MENVIMKGLVNWWAMNVNRSLRAVSQWICRPPRNPSKNSSSFQHHVQRYPCDGLYLFLCKRTGKWKSRLSTSRGKQVDCNMDWNMEHGAWSWNNVRGSIECAWDLEPGSANRMARFIHATTNNRSPLHPPVLQRTSTALPTHLSFFFCCWCCYSSAFKPTNGWFPTLVNWFISIINVWWQLMK